MTRPIPVILDGDPGHDDAIAWVLAKASPCLEILAVTSVCGNQIIEKTTYNAQRIMALIGLDVPVAKGDPRPIIAEPIIAPVVHGQSGLDGPALPEPKTQLSPLSAVELMAQAIADSEEPVTLIPTGPLTNVAKLLLAYPDLKPKIAQISLMGGGVKMGNWTPAAEFNILVDPEAARLVFRSGIPIIMAGLDVTEKALVCPEDFQRIRAVGNQVAVTVADWLEFFYQFHKTMDYPGAPIHDAVAVAALVKPEILTMQEMYVDVEVSGDYCTGCTVGDWYGSSGKKPNVKVLLDIDREAFVDLLVDAVKTYGEVE